MSKSCPVDSEAPAAFRGEAMDARSGQTQTPLLSSKTDSPSVRLQENLGYALPVQSPRAVCLGGRALGCIEAFAVRFQRTGQRFLQQPERELQDLQGTSASTFASSHDDFAEGQVDALLLHRAGHISSAPSWIHWDLPSSVFGTPCRLCCSNYGPSFNFFRLGTE